MVEGVITVWHKTLSTSTKAAAMESKLFMYFVSRLYQYLGREQSMKPMIGKSIDQSMKIDALLVNWHRLASANRWPIDNHTKVVATHRLSLIGIKKSRYSTRSSLYVYALAVRTNVWDLNLFTGLFVCSYMVSKLNNRNTLYNSVLKKHKSTTHLFA